MMQQMADDDQVDPTLPPNSAAMSDGPDDPSAPMTPVIFQWKRLLVMWMVSWVHAASGAVMIRLEKIRDRIAQEKLREYNRVSGRPAVTEIPTESVEVRQSDPAYKDPLFEPLTRGNPTTRSGAKGGKFDLEPANCPHFPNEGLKKYGARGKDGPTHGYTCMKCGSRWERGWTPQEVKKMEAALLNICEDQELTITDSRLVHKTCWLEKDAKLFRTQLSKQVHWYNRRAADGSIIEGKPPIGPKSRPPTVILPVRPGESVTVPASQIPEQISANHPGAITLVSASGPPPKAPTQPPSNIVITRIGNQGHGLIGLAPPDSPLTGTPTIEIRDPEDMRESSTTVMKKRVVSVASQESSDGSDFHVIPSPTEEAIATKIEGKYQELLANGCTSEEALQNLMNQVNSQEMPAFMQWMNGRMQQLTSLV